MAATIRVFVPSTQIFCAGFRANGRVFHTLYDLADRTPPSARVQCWRKLEALLKSLPPTLPIVDVDVPVPDADGVQELCDAHLEDADRDIAALHRKWSRHWCDEDLSPDVRAFALRATTVLTEAYRISAEARHAG